MLVSSDALPSPSGEERWPDHRLSWAFAPFGGERGGDRLRVESLIDGLVFAVVDAAGHGPQAAPFWDRHRVAFEHAWAALLNARVAPGSRLRAFGEALDAALWGTSDSACLTLGVWVGAQLTLSTFGYGTHALVRSAGAAWWTQAEALFGLKLGWIPPGARARTPRGHVINTIPGVDRVVLLSDGLLVNDHRDPQGTLAGLRRLNERLVALPFEQVLPALLAERPAPLADDLTLAVLERTH